MPASRGAPAPLPRPSRPWQVKQALTAPASPPLQAISSPVPGTDRSRSSARARRMPVPRRRLPRRPATPYHAQPLLTIRSILPLMLLVAGCAPAPEWTHALPEADPARGLRRWSGSAAAAATPSPACAGRKARSGRRCAASARLTSSPVIFPNRPDVLSAYLRNAPALLPGTTMPAMPLTEQESRDVAAYLYTLVDALTSAAAGRRRCSIRPARTPARSRRWPGCCSRWPSASRWSCWPRSGSPCSASRAEGEARRRPRRSGSAASPSRSSC